MNFNINYRSRIIAVIILAGFLISPVIAQGTRLLRQPDISTDKIVFTYGADIWVSDLSGENVLRITSTPAVESDPYFSPDGKMIAFSSNRQGVSAVYVVPVTGGEPTRLTWHPSSGKVCGWTPDGNNILYASSRNAAPSGFNRLWTVPLNGGPASMLTSQWATSGSFEDGGKRIAIDRMSRWDVEWRAYRGGQNTSLVILDLKDMSEVLIPNESTTDIQPLWMGDKIYFLSDRDMTSNIWSYSPENRQLTQVTDFTGSDIKWLSGNANTLAYERDGYLFTFDPASGKQARLNIIIKGDFPWAETKWTDVSKSVRAVSLSPSGKRAVMESRGEVFTVPVKYGDYRNITESSGAADRSPVWSPVGDRIAWFSDKNGKGYSLMIASQDGMSEPEEISIGESKMAWEPCWSYDGRYIAFTDDDVRIRVIDIESRKIQTIDTAGTNLERGSMGLCWSHDSKWLAYSRGGENNFRQIVVWSVENGSKRTMTDKFADAISPAWDRDNSHLYFLASTDVALGSGWANTSSMTADPEYSAYVINLRKDDPSPFAPRSDEEENANDKPEQEKKKEGDNGDKSNDQKDKLVIDFDRLDRRTVALPVPARRYRSIVSAGAGTVFITESVPNKPGLTIHKFSLKDREAKEFLNGSSMISVSADGKKLISRVNGSWKVLDTGKPDGKGGEALKLNLQVRLDRQKEWRQIFEEAWRYEKDYFYDKNMHGRDWDDVYKRYSPLVPFIRHRADLTYILDQMNGELSVGHSFVGGGDYPGVDKNMSGLLGADIKANKGYWQIERIYTTENWNPGLSSPLDRPGIKIKEGYYIVGINGKEIKSTDNLYRKLDGTAGKQISININSEPAFKGSWIEVIKPLGSERALRQRAWVEDNRRLVDSLSGGRLAYIWVPNTGGPGFVSFNRYYFAQQDKEGAIIDERFNGGGLLDDYMVDLMTRSLRAALTNEVPGGKHMRLPAGVLGPKALLINELSGSGGDFFPWVFRQQEAGPLIGSRTWGGLVKSSVHYRLVDGGTITAPDNAVFDPVKGEWVAENKGVPPDIDVRQDARSLQDGRDPQLERAVKELLLMLEGEEKTDVEPPSYPEPAKKKK